MPVNLLREAIIKQDLDAVKWLMDNNYDINTKNNYDDSILFTVASVGNVECLKELLKYEAIRKTINSRNVFGNTPLLAAVLNNNQGMVKLLLENGADPTIKNRAGITILDVAKQYNVSGDNIKLLEDHMNSKNDTNSQDFVKVESQTQNPLKTFLDTLQKPNSQDSVKVESETESQPQNPLKTFLDTLQKPEVIEGIQTILKAFQK